MRTNVICIHAGYFPITVDKSNCMHAQRNHIVISNKISIEMSEIRLLLDMIMLNIQPNIPHLHGAKSCPIILSSVCICGTVDDCRHSLPTTTTTTAATCSVMQNASDKSRRRRPRQARLPSHPRTLCSNERGKRERSIAQCCGGRGASRIFTAATGKAMAG